MSETKSNIVYWLAGAGIVFLFARSRSRTSTESVLDYAASLIISFEGYRAKPYWDVKRYSWGYGTPAPGSTGYISEDDARAELMAIVLDDYRYLKPMITYPLTPWQWAALLSFSYNLGKGNADNLIVNINSESWGALRDQWLRYVYADGVIHPGLQERRKKELQYFFS